MNVRIWMLSLLLTPLAVLANEPPPAVVAATAVKASRTATDARSSAPANATRSSAETGDAKADKGPKVISGMSILGNQEAPKSLVIVPWKSSEIGDSIGIAAMLDDSRQPVDRDVFARELAYYQVRTESK